jgi:hypothetical protein
VRPALQYRVQFTADQAYVDLLEQARALLWHQLPNGDLVELQRLALQALVDKLAKRKFGAKPAAPERNPTECPEAPPPVVGESVPCPRDLHLRSRRIPVAVRREVWARDGGRCAFVDARGQRCRSTAAIEFHHQVPHARGGPATLENIGLRCRTHNQLAAEQDFGRDLMLGAQRREFAGRCQDATGTTDTWSGATNVITRPHRGRAE